MFNIDIYTKTSPKESTIMRLQIIFLTFCAWLSAATRTGDLTVTKISRISHADEDHFEIHVDGGKGGFNHFHLNFIHGSEQLSIDSVTGASLTTKTKATFKGNLNDYANEAVRFDLTQRDDNDDEMTYGDLPITLPDFPTAAAPAWVGVNDDYSLRIADKATITGYQYDNKDCTASDGTPCYFIDVTKNAMGKPEFCKEITGVKVCDKTLTPGDATGTVVNPATAELAYAVGGTAAKVKVAVTHSSKAITSTEVLVYKEDASIVKACTSSPCTVGNITPKDVLTVITVGIDTDAPADTGKQTLTDYVLVGTVLSNSLIETKWTRQASQDTYYVQTDGVGAADFTATTVTCQDAENTADFHCFAYFTGLDQGTAYPITVKITDDTAEVFVTLTDTATGTDDKDMVMELTSVNTKWNKGLRSFEVNACFNRVETTDLSSYEAILINKHGQWKKANGVSQKFGNEFCFEDISLDGHSFDLSENLTLVALRRAKDGITVLESVQNVISV